MDNNIINIIGIKMSSINLFPESIVEEIIQNIKIILTTKDGTVPLDRNFGLPTEFIDDPEPRAMMKLSIFILESIQDYEPRVEVKGVDFIALPDKALEGGLYPKVTVRILDEYLSG